MTVYFACIGKGQVLMPVTLKHLLQKMKKSKVGWSVRNVCPTAVPQVKVYHPSSLELSVYSKKSTEEVLEEIDCPVERMQAQEPPASNVYSYSRGDIPMFNFDDCDRQLLATLQVSKDSSITS